MSTPASEKNALNAIATHLRILGHPSRLAIALLLLDGACAVSEIESALGLRQPNLSQHLGVLRDANLLTASRRAKSVVYELASGLPMQLAGAVRAAMDGATAASPQALAAPAAPVVVRAAPTEPADALMFAHVIERRTDD